MRMADTFTRRLRILEMLKRKDDGTITAPEIKFQLSLHWEIDQSMRGIQRDLEYLSLTFPVSCDDTKKPFQWWWTGKESIDIPGMGKFSALTFKLTQQYLEPLLPKKNLEYLIPKFKQSKKVLDESKKEKNWVNKIRVVPKMLEQIPAKISVGVHDEVYNALYEEKMLKITYHSRSKNEISTRKVHPLGLIYRETTSELIASEENQTVAKRYILNRIKKAKIQLQSVSVPDGFNLDQFIQKELGFSGSCKEIKLKAWLHKYARHNVEETQLSKFQTIEETNDGGIIVTATVRDTAELSRWILGLGARIKVIEPKKLKNKISNIAKEMG